MVDCGELRRASVAAVGTLTEHFRFTRYCPVCVCGNKFRCKFRFGPLRSHQMSGGCDHGSVHAGLATTVVAVVCVTARSAWLPGAQTGLTQPSLDAGSRRGAFAGVHGVSPLRGSVLLVKFEGGGKNHNVWGANRAGADGVVLGA